MCGCGLAIRTPAASDRRRRRRVAAWRSIRVPRRLTRIGPLVRAPIAVSMARPTCWPLAIPDCLELVSAVRSSRSSDRGDNESRRATAGGGPGPSDSVLADYRHYALVVVHALKGVLINAARVESDAVRFGDIAVVVAAYALDGRATAIAATAPDARMSDFLIKLRMTAVPFRCARTCGGPTRYAAHDRTGLSDSRSSDRSHSGPRRGMSRPRRGCAARGATPDPVRAVPWGCPALPAAGGSGRRSTVPRTKFSRSSDDAYRATSIISGWARRRPVRVGLGATELRRVHHGDSEVGQDQRER